MTTKIFKIAQGESLGKKRMKAICEFAKKEGYQGMKYLNFIVGDEVVSIANATNDISHNDIRTKIICKYNCFPEAIKEVFSEKPLNNKKAKQYRIMNDLLENVKTSLLSKIEKIPERWQDIELRKYLIRHVEKTIDTEMVQSERREFINDLFNKNL